MSFNLSLCNDSSCSNNNAHAFLKAIRPRNDATLLFSGHHTGDNVMLTHSVFHFLLILQRNLSYPSNSLLLLAKAISLLRGE